MKLLSELPQVAPANPSCCEACLSKTYMQASALAQTGRHVGVQALEADGMDADEAVKRVQRATEDMHAILGALECASDLVAHPLRSSVG